MNDSELKDLKIIEALIFASTEPISENDLEEKITNKEKLNNLLINLQKHYEHRGVILIKTGDHWSFRTSPDLSDNLVILKKQKRKLSRAAQEVLAIIAYHQPVTRAEIEEIRGVHMGRGSIDNLLEIGWIKPKGRRNSPGKPITWATSETFLQHFGLENLESLPNKEELKASGFLEKKSAISTITDIAKQNELSSYPENEKNEEENLQDFISENQ